MSLKIDCLCVQALQAQLLQRLAASGTPSLAHVSQLPRQTIVVSNGLSQNLQPVQPCVSMPVLSQQQQPVTPSSDKNTSVQQLGDSCLNSSVSWCDSSSGRCSQSDPIRGESCQNSEGGVGQSASVDMLHSSQAASEAAESYIQSQPASCDELQHCGQSGCTDQHNSSETVTSASHSPSTSHRRVLEQLQQALLQSSAKHAVNGRDNGPLSAGCNGEEGEVDSNELMRFLS